MKEFIKTLLLALIMAVLMLQMLIGAAIQQSFRNCPPTAAELASDPTLERYLP
jgi:hypothetical protein